jgi:hypothetical protein
MTTFCYNCRKLIVSATGEWKYSALSSRMGQVYFCSKKCAEFQGIDTNSRTYPSTTNKYELWNRWIISLIKERKYV